MNRHLLLCALLGAAAFAHAEQVYKWTDAQGITHYSDAPPPAEAQNVQTVRVSGGDRPHPVASTEANAESPDAKPNANGGPAPASTVPDNADNRARNCQTAHENLELLQSKFPVTVTDSKGKAQPIDDKSRQAAVADANAQIAQFCK